MYKRQDKTIYGVNTGFGKLSNIRIDEADQEKLQLKAELQLSENNTQIQKDTSSRNWFIVGAIVLFFGMMIGFIIPNLLKRKRF